MTHFLKPVMIPTVSGATLAGTRPRIVTEKNLHPENTLTITIDLHIVISAFHGESWTSQGSSELGVWLTFLTDSPHRYAPATRHAWYWISSISISSAFPGRLCNLVAHCVFPPMFNVQNIQRLDKIYIFHVTCHSLSVSYMMLHVWVCLSTLTSRLSAARICMWKSWKMKKKKGKAFGFPASGGALAGVSQ